MSDYRFANQDSTPPRYLPPVGAVIETWSQSGGITLGLVENMEPHRRVSYVSHTNGSGVVCYDAEGLRHKLYPGMKFNTIALERKAGWGSW